MGRRTRCKKNGRGQIDIAPPVLLLTQLLGVTLSERPYKSAVD